MDRTDDLEHVDIRLCFRNLTPDSNPNQSSILAREPNPGGLSPPLDPPQLRDEANDM
jgi:hypothetical protein